MSSRTWALAATTLLLTFPACAEQVWRVGSWRGMPGTHSSIQAAVDAASPGDWILIAPGDYHENARPDAGVFISKPRLHLRGLDRNRVIVDGTRPGASDCSSAAIDQIMPAGGGRNGIVALKVDGVSIENLTVCNYLDSGSGENGNQVWWNGGDDSGVIGMGSFHGAFLTASSTFASNQAAGLYGMFAVNSRGPGVFEDSYASNMADSGFYVGGCRDCNTVLRRVHSQNNAEGFSGTNAGGNLVLEDSEWDHNRVGISHTSLGSHDEPSPQNGACVSDPDRRCTMVRRNDIHHNNNANAPAFGFAGLTPVGTGILVSGGRDDLVEDNLIHDNGAWGVLLTDFPDPNGPSDAAWCTGGIPFFQPTGDDAQILAPYLATIGGVIPCYFHAFGAKVTDNRFYNNGGFRNPGNADLANAGLSYAVDNCFTGNKDLGDPSISSAPLHIQNQNVLGVCGRQFKADVVQESTLFFSLLCDTFGAGSDACASFSYPKQTQVALTPIPRLRGLDDPCDGVPANPWCRRGDDRHSVSDDR